MDPDSSGGWRFAQCFGDKGEVEDITEGRALPFHPPLETPLTGQTLSAADVISTVEFDSTGNYLATGDKGGRVVLFERNEQVRSFPFLRPSAFLRADWILSLNPFPSLFPSCRRRAVNTSFTQSSNHMSPSSIISSRLRSRRRLTRSSGVNDRMPLTFCCLPTVRVRDGVSYLPCSERSTEVLILDRLLRQDHQIMEGFRKIPARSVRVQPLGWSKKPADTVISLTSPVAKDDATRQHHRRRSPQGLRKRSRIPHPLHLCQFRSRNLHLCR